MPRRNPSDMQRAIRLVRLFAQLIVDPAHNPKELQSLFGVSQSQFFEDMSIFRAAGYGWRFDAKKGSYEFVGDRPFPTRNRSGNPTKTFRVCSWISEGRSEIEHIVGLRNQGWTPNQIAIKLDIAETSVRRVFSRFAQEIGKTEHAPIHVPSKRFLRSLRSRAELAGSDPKTICGCGKRLFGRYKDLGLCRTCRPLIRKTALLGQWVQIRKPTKAAPELVEAVIGLKNEGVVFREIGERLGIHPTTACSLLQGFAEWRPSTDPKKNRTNHATLFAP